MWSAARSRPIIAWWLIQMIPIVRNDTTYAAYCGQLRDERVAE